MNIKSLAKLAVHGPMLQKRDNRGKGRFRFGAAELVHFRPDSAWGGSATDELPDSSPETCRLRFASPKLPIHGESFQPEAAKEKVPTED